MSMAVDEPGQDDRIRRVDDIDVADSQRWPHFADEAVLDQDVGPHDVADGAVERQHRATLDQHFGPHRIDPSPMASSTTLSDALGPP